MSITEINLIISEILKFLPYLIPVVIIEYGLLIFALVQLAKNEVKYMPKWGWVLIIVFVNIIGSIVFLLIGRKRDEE
ncbi:MAG: PLD nuclease N-terminal domain-containing protein [Actinobacteria bacterium]|nr:PLD nuclease N-terminal domain-containing protein [Actinomycetota bacterium]